MATSLSTIQEDNCKELDEENQPTTVKEDKPHHTKILKNIMVQQKDVVVLFFKKKKM
jgi:hypothetical protein